MNKLFWTIWLFLIAIAPSFEPKIIDIAKMVFPPDTTTTFTLGSGLGMYYDGVMCYQGGCFYIEENGTLTRLFFQDCPYICSEDGR